jgi:hypothetical protein
MEPELGVTHLSDISGPDASPVIPDYVVNSLGDFAVLAKGNSA